MRIDCPERLPLPPAVPGRSTATEISCDVAVIGSGVAGLRAAWEAASAGAQVVLLAKERLGETNSFYAQGGVAAVISEEDTFEEHVSDTIGAGQGLCDERRVRLVVEEGAGLVLEVISWGGRFDRVGGRLALAQEGGHSRPRIVRAHGDQTGREFHRVLLHRVRTSQRIHLHEHAFALDFLVADGECRGVLVAWSDGRVGAVRARATVLATGGAGQLYRETTNPPVATGDGIAMAYRAGVRLADLEFVQFHPTTLYVAGSARQLISEAVRGEGAYLRDTTGRRFVLDHDPRGELAPRDIVSRAIVDHLRRTGESRVYLDLRHLDAGTLRARFPRVTAVCEAFGIDVTRDPVPVHPSAHYFVGGALVGDSGETTLPGLYAAGECTASGLHGANRLGSNSLLECLVFGKRAGEAAAAYAPRERSADLGPAARPGGERRFVDLPDLVSSLRSLMWRSVGVERTGPALGEAAEELARWAELYLEDPLDGVEGWEAQNRLVLARLVTAAALLREESRGVHCRLDHPERDDARWSGRLVVRRGEDFAFRPGLSAAPAADRDAPSRVP
jgi:L-aspartate oxidase